MRLLDADPRAGMAAPMKDNSPIAIAIARPVTVIMATLAVILFGGLSLQRLGLNLLPELAYPTLTVRTDFEGAAPAEIEEQITRRVEERVGVINGLRQMHSISAAERSDVVLEFAWGTDMNLAAVEVREKLDLVRLPLEIERPSLLRLNPSLDPIVRLAVLLKPGRDSRPALPDGVDGQSASELPAQVQALQDLRRYGEDILKKRLDPILGVAAVLVSGGYEDEIAVHVDQQRLTQLNLTVEALGQRLQATNVNLSGGRLTDAGREFLVRTLNEYQSVADIGDTIIFQQGGRILRLRDVAQVTASYKDRDAVMRVDGFEAIEVALYKEGDANTVAVAAAIGDKLAEIRGDLPPEFELVTIYDQAVFIDAAIREVRSAAIVGAGLAVLVLFLFLRDLRSTLIITATIPISVMATFTMMDAFDITLNIMSLGGIALAVGMLMDNAIVVLENIARHREEGKSLFAAAQAGASEVGGAVFAATLTTIAVFLPLAFVEGIAGQLFRDQALTVTFALIASLLLAFTLIPMLSAVAGEPRAKLARPVPIAAAPGGWRHFASAPIRWPLSLLVATTRVVYRGLAGLLRPIGWAFDRLFTASLKLYQSVLRLALRVRLLTLVLAALALTGAVLLVARLPIELIPPLSQGEFRVDVELAPGSRIEMTDALLEEIQVDLLETGVVARTYSVAGSGGRLDAAANQGGEQVGELNIVLPDGVAPQEEQAVMAFTRARLTDEPDLQYKVDRPQLFTLSTPLAIEISGNDLLALERISSALVAAMSTSSTFGDVESSMRSGYPELQIKFDQERAAALDMFVPDIANRVAQKIRGDVPTTFTWRDKKVDIRVRLDETERDSRADVENLLINAAGQEQIRLSAVADVLMATGPADIQRIGQQRVAVVTAYVNNGDLATAAVEVRRYLDGIPHPLEVVSRVGGQNAEMEASFASLQLALLLALVMVYLVMASLFESFLHPFVIMFTVPLAGVGAAVGLWVTDTSISVVVFIGLILLVGIVVNNAIVLIDRINQLRADGMAKFDAILAGTTQRFRPVLMTTVTTILGLLPMAIGLGEAAEIRTPMAVTVIGGLLVSTALTLIVIPVLYDLVDRQRDRVAATVDEHR